MSDKSKLRRYGQWAGNPEGRPEDPARCAESVPLGGGSIRFAQCGKPRGYGDKGEWCKRHARRHPATKEAERG